MSYQQGHGCQAWSLTQAIVKKLETNQRAMERKMLNVKQRGRILNTIIRQRTRVTDIVQYVTDTKWKWAGHFAQMKDNGCTTTSTEWQTKGRKVSWKIKTLFESDIVGQQGAEWTRRAKDRESWRTLAECFFLW